MTRNLLIGLGAVLLSVTAVPGMADVTLSPLTRYETGVFEKGAAEISTFDKDSKRLFVVNGATASVDIFDMSNPSKLVPVGKIDIAAYGAGVNSVAFKNGVLAAAIEAKPKQQPGTIAFFKADGSFISKVTAGALPDMIGFTPNGRYVLTANEGEPNDAYEDPEGSITIVDLKNGADKLTDADVKHVNFQKIEKAPEGARIGKPGQTFAQDAEPEYIAFSPDSRTAYVGLQENNALAMIDIASASLTKVVGLGFQDHKVHPLDASDKDGGINIKNWQVKGVYMPDTLAAFAIDGKTYILSANEGDGRDYKAWGDEERIAKLKLDPAAFPNAAELQDGKNLGRLKAIKTLGDANGDGLHEEIYVYGARSFSIWDADGKQVADSGADFEKITAERFPAYFNSSRDSAKLDDRSDDKGPEPEGIAVGQIDGKTYAFIGLERMGGVMIYDVSTPAKPRFIDYVTSRDFTGDHKGGKAGDLAPEGLLFIGASDSPNGKPLLVVTSEVSGSTAVFEVVKK
ncbi:choice-of-anchor I family protein [Lacibacterium aquatile]|uniref:Choice-of-anchor I family protein n=1 Tax=Lacibacterium aquatile TaxID=1168082 RepID=A0ABW5DLM5_9PROT